MDHDSLQVSGGHKTKKSFLLKGPLPDFRKFQTRFKNRNRRALDGGFFEIEMLVWVSIIFLILLGYFSIYKSYRNEHQKVQEEFQDEWAKLNSTKYKLKR